MAAIDESKAATQVACIMRVSPSRAAALLGCQLSEAFRAANCLPRLPTHPKAHFGILVHDFVKDASRGLFKGMDEIEIRNRWESLVRLYEENLLADSVERIVVPISSSCDDFEVNAIRTIKIVARLASQQANWQTSAATSRKGIEAKISSGDGLIVGRLDRYRWEDGSLVVTDIKTGKTSNQNGKLNRELTMQLMLYAYLLHERFGQWPKSLKIITLRGETIEVPFSPDEAENLAAQMKQRLIETDKSIGEVIEGKRLTNTLASPSPEVCRFCRYRPSCASYWEERQKTPELAWPRDISGTVIESKFLGHGLYMLELQNHRNERLIIRGVKESAMETIGTRKTIFVCDLYSERAQGVFSWRPISSIFPAPE